MTERETYTEAALKRKNLTELGEIADEHGIDIPVDGSKAEIVEVILGGIPKDVVEDDADDAASEPDAEPDDAPDVPEGLVLLVGLTAPNRTSLWERHRDHPGGEVNLRGGERAAAANTPGVQRAVRELRVRIVDGK